MIQPIKDVRTGIKFVCEIPAEWNVAMIYTGGKISIVMAHPSSAPVLLQEDADGVWRQTEISVGTSPPQK